MEYLLLCFALIVLFIILSGIKIVKQQSVMIVETLGKFSKVLSPGINVIIPLIQTVRSTQYLYIQNLEFQIVAITSDKVTITLDTALVYHIQPEKAADAYYSIGDPLAVIKSTVENSVRSYVANQTHEEILQKRDELTEYLIDHLTKKFNEWGRVIDAFQVKDVVLPREITDAMSKVIASKRLQEAAEFEANASKIIRVKAAEAEREARKLSGLGVAEEREAIINGLKISVENMQSATGADTQSVMNVVLLTQYMDAIKSIGMGENSKVVFMNSNPASIQEVMQQMTGLLKENK